MFIAAFLVCRELAAIHPSVPTGRVATYSSYAVGPTMRQETSMRVLECGVLVPSELTPLLS